MKKVFLCLSIVALGLASCSKTEIVPDNKSDGAIIFKTYATQSTRAEVTDITALQGSAAGFGVYAYSDVVAPNFMTNVNVTYTDPNWTYSPIMYWPTNNVAVSFFAYAPWVDQTATTPNPAFVDSDTPGLTYVTDSEVAEQIDLLAANNIDVTRGTAAGNVALEFNHILSRIGFSAATNIDDANTAIAVTSFTVTYSADAVGSTNTYDLVSGTWNDALTGSLTGPNTIVDANIDVPEGPTATVALNADNEYFMLIPQELAEGDLTYEITYTVTTGSAVTTNNFTGNLPAVTLAAGMAYTFNLDISLQAVTFSVDEVVAWNETTPATEITLN